MYFAFSELHSWVKSSAEGRRRLNQRLQKKKRNKRNKNTLCHTRHSVFAYLYAA